MQVPHCKFDPKAPLPTRAPRRIRQRDVDRPHRVRVRTQHKQRHGSAAARGQVLAQALRRGEAARNGAKQVIAVRYEASGRSRAGRLH